MKKIIFFIALIYFIGNYSYSQTYIVQVKPVGSETWKYANIKGDIIINIDFPVIYPFSEDGIAVVYYPRKNLYNLINTKGEEINTEIQDFYLKDVFGYGAKGYSDGLIIVRHEKKWGCLDTAGKIAIPMKYDNLLEFNKGYGIGRIDKTFYILDRKGNKILIENKDIVDVKHFTENLAPYESKNGKKGFIDINGKIIIPTQFSGLGYFNNGFAWAKNSEGLIGYINNIGEWVIKPQFSVVKDFDKESGLARVRIGKAWVYVNEKGEIISFNISETTDDFSEGLAKGRKDFFEGFYNNKGEWVIKPQYQGVRDFKNGFAAAKVNELWGIIDKQGNWIIKPIFAGVKDVIIIK
jgi:hypothetical protein